MAEWTNLFDLGECTVTVLTDYAGEVFSGVMAKGDSATFSDQRPDPEIYTIAVSVNGVVSLSTDAISQYNNNRFDVLVKRTGSPANSDFPARVRGAVFDGSTISAYGFISFEGPDNLLPYTALSPAAPEPLDMSALTAYRGGVGVHAEPGF